MKALLKPLVVLGLLASQQAWAVCSPGRGWQPAHSTYQYDLPFQVAVNLNYAGINGKVADSSTYYAPTPGGVNTSYSYPSFKCDGGEDIFGQIQIEGQTHLGNGVYTTGVAGLGIRPLVYPELNWTWKSGSWSVKIGSNPGWDYRTQDSLRFELVRTGINVDVPADGVRIPLSFKYTSKPSAGDTSVTITSRPGFSIVVFNSVFFQSCVSEIGANETQVVPMGNQWISHVKNGSAETREFSIHILCDSPMVSGVFDPKPVKIYFAGDTTTPTSSQLNLSDKGTQGVASGVAIKVTRQDGGNLPFAKASALTLPRNGTGPGGEYRYSFTGHAKYVSTSPTVTAGRADAEMTYVLEYN
jgi:type 1 fimbria pilin